MLWFPAAFVADIYGTAQLQGPALSMTNSSHLNMQYTSDPELLLLRIGAAVEEVNPSSCLPARVCYASCLD